MVDPNSPTWDGKMTVEIAGQQWAPIVSDGGSTSYYELPEGAKELNDLIEYKRMSFALGNIFKACYRYGEKSSADKLYDLNKIKFFADRLIALENKK